MYPPSIFGLNVGMYADDVGFARASFTRGALPERSLAVASITSAGVVERDATPSAYATRRPSGVKLGWYKQRPPPATRVRTPVTVRLTGSRSATAMSLES